MSHKHTPGPWSVFSEESFGVRPGIEATELDFSVVMFGASDDDAGVRGRTPEEAEANAQLIATAPDMLDALVLILPLAKGYAPEGQTAEAKRTCDAWIAFAEAVIAKATATT